NVAWSSPGPQKDRGRVPSARCRPRQGGRGTANCVPWTGQLPRPQRRRAELPTGVDQRVPTLAADSCQSFLTERQDCSFQVNFASAKVEGTRGIKDVVCSERNGIYYDAVT